MRIGRRGAGHRPCSELRLCSSTCRQKSNDDWSVIDLLINDHIIHMMTCRSISLMLIPVGPTALTFNQITQPSVSMQFRLSHEFGTYQPQPNFHHICRVFVVVNRVASDQSN